MKPKKNLRNLLLIASCTQFIASPALLAQTSWNVDASGNWSNATNWDPATVPGGVGATVNFTNNITTAARTIIIDDASRTVGIINIGDSNNTHRFIIERTSPNTLTFNNDGLDAQLNETGFINNNNPDAINVPVILASNLLVDAAGEIRLLAAVSETGGAKTITKTGSGILRLNVANSYTGATNVNAGTINISNNTSLGTTAGNTIVASGATVYSVSNAVTALAEAFNISGTGVGGNGALRIGGGTTMTLSGAVTLGADARIQTDGGVTLSFTGGIDIAGYTVTLAPNGAAFNIDTVGITGAGSVIKSNAGPVTFNAANSHSVSTTLNQGTITVGATGNLSGTTATLTVNNTNTTAAGTNVVLNLSPGSDTTVGTLGGNIQTPLSGTNTATINTQSGRTLLVNQTSNAAYAGVIAGDGSFTLGSSSSAILTLSGANTYTGATKIDAGTLKLGSTGSLSNATSVSIAAGATLDLTDKTAASDTYTWNTASLSASGAATPAAITGTAGGTIDMGTKPISLTTDATNPSLTVTGAALALDATTFTVVVPGTALTPGVYTLVSAPSITGTVNPTASYTGGNGLASGATGVVSISGNNIILTVTSSASPYGTWATGGEGFTDDANNDGVDNGLAWFLGASDPAVNALDKLPVPSTPAGFLQLNFTRRNPYAPSKLFLEYGDNLTGWTKLEIPATTSTIGGDIEVTVTAGPPDTIQIKIPATHAVNGKLFARLSANEN